MRLAMMQKLQFGRHGREASSSALTAAMPGIDYYIANEGGTYKAYIGATGAVLSSSADFDTVQQAVIADIGTDAAHVLLGPGDFDTDEGFQFVSSNLLVEGAGVGVTNIRGNVGAGLDTTGIFEHDNAQTATPYALTVDATLGDQQLTISSGDLTASGIAVGDYIILYSSLGIDTEFTGRNQGEIHRVASVDTGTGVIGLGNDNVYQTTLISDTARVAKLTMRQNVTIRNMTVTDLATSRPSTHPGAFIMRFIDNLVVENVQVHDAYNTGVLVAQCLNAKTDTCDLRDMKDVSPTANTWYGIAAKGATNGLLVVNCTFDNMRHGFVQGAGNATFFAGITRNVSVVNCNSRRSATGHFDAHQACVGLTFVGNTCIGDDGGANGIQTRSQATIVGNTMVGIRGRGVSLFGGAHGSIIKGNIFVGCTDAWYVDKGVNKPVISGNQIMNGTRGGQLARQVVALSSISNATPAVITATAHTLTPGVRLRFTTTGTLPTGLSLNTDYYIIATGITPNTFQVSLTPGGAAVATSSAGSGTHSMTIYSGDDAIISDNNVHDNSSYGFGSDGQQRVKVSGNKFDRNSIPFQVLDTDGSAQDWHIADNDSTNHTSTNIPTINGLNPYIKGNKGFEVETKFYRAITALRTLGLNDEEVDCTSGTFTVTLPTAVNARGRHYIVKNSGTGVITVDGNSSETIDGDLTVTLSQGEAVTITSNGTNWIVKGVVRKTLDVRPKTQAVSPYSLTAIESGKVFTNEGATSVVTFNLPSAVAGLDYTFIVQDGDGLTVTAASGDTIRVGAVVTATAGNAASTSQGSLIRLRCINDTEWIGEIEGSWVLT